MFNAEGAIGGYPKVWNFGHPEVAGLLGLDDTIVVQEKLDGSQFSFGTNLAGELRIRSKGAVINPSEPPKLFKLAVEWVVANQAKLVPGMVFRGEAITSRQHNTLQYDRFPETGIILFDIEYRDPVTGIYEHWFPAAVAEYARFLGLEPVHTLAIGRPGEVFGTDLLSGVDQMLQMSSMLGGQIEGIVVKNYSKFGADGKFLAAKFVRPEFRELHAANWKSSSQVDGSGNYATAFLLRVNKERAWEKAIQRLRDAGELEGSMRDMPSLMREIGQDANLELRPEFAEFVMRKEWPKLAKAIVRGAAEYYKAKLLGEQADAYAREVLVASDHPDALVPFTAPASPPTDQEATCL